MTDVDRVHEELSAVIATVEASDSVSDLIAIQTIAAKALLLSAASYFERTVCEIIVGVAKESGTRPLYSAFIDKQALERRYHSMFDWDGKNINKFFGLFGADVRGRLSEKSKNADVAEAVSAFIFIGSKRNLLVHENFAGFSLDVTFPEVYGKYQTAFRLMDWLRVQLRAEAGILVQAAG
jgi:hypothetical protein